MKPTPPPSPVFPNGLLLPIFNKYALVLPHFFSPSSQLAEIECRNCLILAGIAVANSFSSPFGVDLAGESENHTGYLSESEYG